MGANFDQIFSTFLQNPSEQAESGLPAGDASAGFCKKVRGVLSGIQSLLKLAEEMGGWVSGILAETCLGSYVSYVFGARVANLWWEKVQLLLEGRAVLGLQGDEGPPWGVRCIVLAVQKGLSCTPWGGQD